MRKKLFTLLFAILASVEALFASNTQVDGIWYEFQDSKAYVTYRGSEWGDWGSYTDRYSGHVVIPDTVKYNGKKYTVTNIDGYAFFNCSSLTSIEIPNSVTSIGGRAFQGCTSLTSVELPENLRFIGEGVFYNCFSLDSIIIPKEVNHIGKNVFFGCRDLSAITWNAKNCPSVDNSSDAPFYDVCTQVASFALGDSVETIPNYLCEGMKNITSVIIPDQVTTIGRYAFSGCESLITVSMSNNVTSIGYSAFSGCSVLNSINISNGITCIEDYTFSGCNSLASIEIPNSVTSIGYYAFGGCSNLESITIPTGITSIKWATFYNCSNLAAIIIPNSVTSIGSEAFSGCNRLASIEIPNSVTSIGDYAFAYCIGLTSVEIPNSVTGIGNNVVSGCKNLVSIVVEDGNSLFDSRGNCNAIIETNTNKLIVGCKNTVIQESVTTIGEYAFYKCSGLKNIIVPNNVTSIGRSAFYDCFDLTSITIPESITSIGYEAFYNVPNVIYSGIATGSPWGARSVNGYIDEYLIYRDASKTELSACSSSYVGNVTIPESVTSIGNDAFYGCSGITAITFPRNLTNIGNGVFYGCDSLTSIIWNTQNYNGITSPFKYYSDYGDHNYDIREQIRSFTFGEDVENIPIRICEGMSQINAITIPNNVTSIGSYAFYNCRSLTSVTIPNSVTSIGYAAFEDCDSLTHITWNARNCNSYNFGSQVESFIFGNDVEVIPDSLCMGMNQLTTINIPDHVKTIGKDAFADCSSLHNLTIGRNVRTIGDEGDKTFYNCTSIDTIVWNAVRCNDMEYSPFYYSRNHVKSFTIADDIERIPSNLCWGIKAIEKLTIPSSVNYIGKDAFYGSNLTEVHIPNSVEEVGIRAFANCPLQKVHWGVANQTDYKEEEFHSTGITVGLDASNLNWSNVYVYAWSSTGSTITSAWPGTKVSKNANGIYTFTFPSSYSKVNIIWNNGTDQTVDITNITSSAIYSLTSSSGKNITYTTRQFTGTPLSPFINSTANLTEFTFGENVKRVPALLCEDMNALTEVIIPQNVEYLGKNAFKGCSNLATLSLGENITTYGENVFAGCPALTSIYNYRDHPAKLGTDAFKDVDYFNCTLYVLAGSVNMYKASGSDWQDFYYIKPIGTTETTVTEDKVTVSPADNSALFTWRTSDDASTYTLQITQDGVVFCTLVFDADGLLKGIAFASGKDGHAHTPAATLTANGMQFTITGLSSASKYAYRLAVTDTSDNLLVAYSGEFATTGYEGEVNEGGFPENSEGLDDVQSNTTHSTKILRDGQVYILTGDKTYTITGAEVK